MHRCGNVCMSNSSVGINRDHVGRRAARNDSVSDTDACHNIITISALFVCTRAQKLWVLMQNFTTSAPAETHDSLMKEEAETGAWHQRSSFYLLFSNIGWKQETSRARTGRLPQISLLFKENIEATFSTQICENDQSPWSLLICFGEPRWRRFLSNKNDLQLCPILNEPGVDNWRRRNGSWKAYFTLCQRGRQILIHPKSAYPIYISKGSNPFNFHEIGCLLWADLETWDTRISPEGFWLSGHHTWEISM